MKLVEVTLHKSGSDADDKRTAFNPYHVLWIQPAEMYDGIPIVGQDTPKPGTRIIFKNNSDMNVTEDYDSVMSAIEDTDVSVRAPEEIHR